MGNINETAEATSRRIVNIFYYIVMTLSIFGIIYGISFLDDDAFGGFMIIVYSVFGILSVKLWQAVIHVVANISCKLDNTNEALNNICNLNKSNVDTTPEK
jgi:hypothetical protein